MQIVLELQSTATAISTEQQNQKFLFLNFQDSNI
jgi:hypothetical protein